MHYSCNNYNIWQSRWQEVAYVRYIPLNPGKNGPNPGKNGKYGKYGKYGPNPGKNGKNGKKGDCVVTEFDAGDTPPVPFALVALTVYVCAVPPS